MSGDEYKLALIQHRLERARVTLRDAHNLYETEGSPVSIVNRSYYAMFYAALAFLASVDQESSKHTGVLSLFNKMFINTKILPVEMSKMLRKAFDVRQMGDYEDNANVDMEQAVQILRFAEQFIKTAEEKLSQENK
jgi:uncharacterized protein (UPF0332 family)